MNSKPGLLRHGAPDGVRRNAAGVFRAALAPVFAGLVLSCLSCLSCAGFGAREDKTTVKTTESEFALGFRPEDFLVSSSMLVFAPAPFPGMLGASGVGLITRESRDMGGSLDEEDRNRLALSFRAAYAEGLFRGLPLAGVLGGDQVHGWPPLSPVTWVQNWRSSEGHYNSWGIPSLILAVRGLVHDKVFLVHDEILDVYGQSAGLKGANGAAGFGSPCGNEFMHQDGLAQRFDFGLITVKPAGGFTFSAGDAPSLTALVPEGIGVFETGEEVPAIRDAFVSVWRTALDSGLPLLELDTPLYYVDMGDPPWILPLDEVEDLGSLSYGIPLEGGFDAGDLLSSIAQFSGETDRETDWEKPNESSIAVHGIYYQVFGRGSAIFLLVDASVELVNGEERRAFRLSVLPHLIDSPFLNAFLSSGLFRLSGAEGLQAYTFPSHFKYGSELPLTRALLDGIARYGLPLASPQPKREKGAFTEAQRFSRGWMRMSAPVPLR